MPGLMNDQQKIIDQKEERSEEKWIRIHPGKRDLIFQSHPVLISQNPAKWNTDHREPPLLYVWQ